MAKDITTYDPFVLFGTDERDELWDKVKTDSGPTIPLREATRGDACPYWVVEGLTEFQNVLKSDHTIVGLTFSLHRDSITLGELLLMAIALHTQIYPHGAHRYFETVTVNQATRTITLDIGS